MSVDSVWITRCPVPTAFSLAVQLGWVADDLAADGISVRSLAVSGSADVRNAHFVQSEPAMFRHGGSIPPLVARSRGTDVRLLGLSWARSYEPVLTLPASGIRTPQDLKGKRLGVPRRLNDSVDFWYAVVLRGYTEALALAGLTFDDVTLVDIPIERAYVADTTSKEGDSVGLWDARAMLGFQREEAAAILRGDVDVVFAHGGHAAILEDFLGAHVVVDLGDPALPADKRINNTTPATLTVTGDLLDAEPEMVARVLAQTLRATAWAKTDPREAARIVADEVGIAEGQIPKAFSRNLPFELDVDLSEERVAALRNQAGLLDRLGLMAGPVDWDGFIAREPLKRAQEILDEAGEPR